jgi:hypothetical protein
VRARALRAPVFLSSLTCKAGRCAPPPPLSQLRCSCLDHTLCILRRALKIHHLVKETKKFSFHWTTEALKKGSIVYYIEYHSLCAVYDWVPPQPFPWKMAPPPLCLSIPCTVFIARQHSLAWAGVGGSKSYDSTETQVRYSIL